MRWQKFVQIQIQKIGTIMTIEPSESEWKNKLNHLRLINKIFIIK